MFESFNLVKKYRDSVEREKAELADYVNCIDHAELQSIIRRRAQLPDEELNYVPLERIVAGGTHGYSGRYDDANKVIHFDLPYMRNYLAKITEVNPEMLGEHIFIHEQVHAVSHGDSHESDDEDDEDRVGYGRRTRIPGTSLTLRGGFFKFNEGVTDKLARELYREYAHNTGSATDADVENYLTHLDTSPRAEEYMYKREIALVDALVDRIAAEVGVPRDIVWKALSRDFFRNERIDGDDFEELAKGILPNHFLEDLSHADAWSTVERLTNELRSGNSPVGTSQVSRKLKRSVESFMASMGRAAP